MNDLQRAAFESANNPGINAGELNIIIAASLIVIAVLWAVWAVGSSYKQFGASGSAPTLSWNVVRIILVVVFMVIFAGT